MPPNIIVDPRLDDVVAGMLRQSPTFRDQSAYLGRMALLRVRVIVRGSLLPWAQSRPRADSVLRRYQFGRIDAVVRLTSDRNAPELIAHELEHVREFVDGVNFRVLAARAQSGVWDSLSGHYETARAVAIGRRVASEVAFGTAPN